MTPVRRWLSGVLFVVVVATSSGFALSRDASSSGTQGEVAVAGRPLHTAILDPDSFEGSEKDLAYQHVRRAGARFIRMFINWADVAPKGASKPSQFDARNPGDPKYDWDRVDSWVRVAVAKGYAPIAYVQSAPAWSQRCSRGPGPCRPSPAALADFMEAAALRFRGGYRGLPRVRYWQIWNEPNLDSYLMPQYDENGRPASPDWYRSMVNASADAIHSVKEDNLVIAGGQSPFGPDAQSTGRIAPLTFMRQLLCLSAERSPRRVCDEKVRFDVWAHHPYTSGGPTHHANNPNDVSAPDLWKMRVLLDAGVRTGNLQSQGPVAFWVTEFAWDTSPPDPKGVPEALHARWVAEVLYRMWDQGVSLVTWFLIRDQPFTSNTPFQAGLYFRGSDGMRSDEPKLALTAFRFPFVAFREPKRKSVVFWGRSPAGRSSVIVERKRGSGWRVVEILRPAASGIFFGRYASSAKTGSVRARLENGNGQALPFSLVAPPDRPGCAWGTC
jgi:hypothetical protein